MIITKAIVPAGGRGTRFLPASKAIPKEMLPILDKPSIQYVIEEGVEANIFSFTVIVGKNKGSIQEHFDGFGPNFVYVRQPEPKGLGHAVWLGRDTIGDEFCAVLLPDDVFFGHSAIRQLMTVAREHNCSVIGVQEMPEDQLYRYGVVSLGEQLSPILYRMNGIIEKPKCSEAPSRLAVVGRYVLSPTIFRILEQQKIGLSGEVQLTDAIQELLAIEPVLACKIEGIRYDTGTPLGLLKASMGMAQRNLGELYECML